MCRSNSRYLGRKDNSFVGFEFKKNTEQSLSLQITFLSCDVVCSGEIPLNLTCTKWIK